MKVSNRYVEREILEIYIFMEMTKISRFHFIQLKSIDLSKKINIISTYFNESDDKQVIENAYFKLFTHNEFIKSVYKSNKVKHFKYILKNFGFEVIESNQRYATFSKDF